MSPLREHPSCSPPSAIRLNNSADKASVHRRAYKASVHRRVLAGIQVRDLKHSPSLFLAISFLQLWVCRMIRFRFGHLSVSPPKQARTRSLRSWRWTCRRSRAICPYCSPRPPPSADSPGPQNSSGQFGNVYSCLITLPPLNVKNSSDGGVINQEPIWITSMCEKVHEWKDWTLNRKGWTQEIW